MFFHKHIFLFKYIYYYSPISIRFLPSSFLPYASLRVGSSREVIWTAPPSTEKTQFPSADGISFWDSQQIVSSCRSPRKCASLRISSAFSRSFMGSLNRAAGYRQIRCHPVDPPALLFHPGPFGQTDRDRRALPPMGSSPFSYSLWKYGIHLLLIPVAKAWRVLTALSPGSISLLRFRCVARRVSRFEGTLPSLRISVRGLHPSTLNVLILLFLPSQNLRCSIVIQSPNLLLFYI